MKNSFQLIVLKLNPFLVFWIKTLLLDQNMSLFNRSGHNKNYPVPKFLWPEICSAHIPRKQQVCFLHQRLFEPVPSSELIGLTSQLVTGPRGDTGETLAISRWGLSYLSKHEICKFALFCLPLSSRCTLFITAVELISFTWLLLVSLSPKFCHDNHSRLGPTLTLTSS